jgi:hypothetical protein
MFAEYIKVDENNTKDKKKTVTPLGVEPCSEDAEWNITRKEKDETEKYWTVGDLTCSSKLNKNVLMGDFFTDEFYYVKFGLKPCSKLEAKDKPIGGCMGPVE